MFLLWSEEMFAQILVFSFKLPYKYKEEKICNFTQSDFRLQPVEKLTAQSILP